MKPVRILLSYLLLFQTGLCQTIIRAEDFGVKKNSFENAAPGIQKAIDACKQNKESVLVLPGGRIDIWPEVAPKRELYISNCTEADTLSKQKNIAFLLEGCNNITIEGNNTLVVLHGKMISFAVIKSVNISIRNTSFDYERPTMSELTISSVSAKCHRNCYSSRFQVFNRQRAYQFLWEGWKTKSYHTILFDSMQNTLHYSSFGPFLKAKAIETKPSSSGSKGTLQNLL
jgi:hypothetical protein